MLPHERLGGDKASCSQVYLDLLFVLPNFRVKLSRQGTPSHDYSSKQLCALFNQPALLAHGYVTL